MVAFFDHSFVGSLHITMCTRIFLRLLSAAQLGKKPGVSVLLPAGICRLPPFRSTCEMVFLKIVVLGYLRTDV